MFARAICSRSSSKVIGKHFSLQLASEAFSIGNKNVSGERCVSSCSIMFSDARQNMASTAREGRMFKNMLSGGGKKKRKHFSFNQHVSVQLKDFGFLSKGTTTTNGQGQGKKITGRVRRRIAVLDNLFLEQITSLLATGEVSPQFIGLGLQIARVKTCPDFSAINVYWYTTGEESDDVIDKLLTRTASHSRHILSQLRVMGVVPPIRFIKDKTYSKIYEVDRLLAKCDFGPDFKSVAAEIYKQGNQTNVKNGDGSSGENSLGVKSNLLSENPDTPLETVMRQDALGVHRDRIMDEILKAMQAKKDRKHAREMKIPAQPTSISDVGYLEPLPEHDDDGDKTVKITAGEGNAEYGEMSLETEIINHRQRQSEFLKYLKKRKAEKEKRLKQETGEALEDEFYSSVKTERYQQALEQRISDMTDDLVDSDNEDEDDCEYADDHDADYKGVYEQMDNDSPRENLKY